MVENRSMSSASPIADAYRRSRSLASAFITIQSRSPRNEPPQPRRLDLPAGRERRQRLRRADPAAGRRRLDLADHPQHLVQRRAAERLAGDRRAAGEQLVEDHAEGVDVGAGVHVQRIE